MNSKIPDNVLVRIFDGHDMPRPTIVCLCGSTKFPEDFKRVELALAKQGILVLTVSAFGHSGDLTPEECEDGHPVKETLDALHKRKIELADCIVAINPGGYIGTSTRSEIAFALSHDRSIHFLSDGLRWADVTQGTHVAGSGTVIGVDQPDEHHFYVTFDRTGHPGEIPPEAPGWFEGCNTWTSGQNPKSEVPVVLNPESGGLVYARRSLWLRNILEGQS